MDRKSQLNQDLNLKQYAIPIETPKPEDLTNRVMIRISNLSSKEKQRKTPMKRSAILLAAALVALVASLTTYATSEYFEIRNAKGEVVLKTTKPHEPLLPSYFTELHTKYSNQANASVEQGQLLANYVNDNVIKDYDQTRLQFTYKNDFSRYEDFIKEIKAKEAPLLLEPEELPEGYQYYNGQVVPAFPISGDAIYEELYTQLLSQAQAEKGQEKVFTALVPWTKSGTAVLVYKKDDTYLYFIASKAMRSEVSQPEGALVKQKNIKGQEVLYVRDDGSEYAVNTVAWFDEKTRIAYHISDSIGSRLTEEEMMSMATSIIKQIHSYQKE